jgi:exodeoxyribonuclease VII large subunit
MVVAAKDDLRHRIDRLQERLRAAADGRVQQLARRVHRATARPAFAGWPGRLAMRGRHVAELTHGLRAAIRQRLHADDRRARDWQRRLEACDLRRRFAGLRTRLVGADGRLREGVSRRRHHANGHLQGLAGRLVTLSPLAVLARGYAVCWDDARTTVVRDAATTPPGTRVRVTLNTGELSCEVRDRNE